MDKNICFVELVRDLNGFFNATQTLETACIRTYLKKNGIESMIYIDDSLPVISDMSDDILSLSDEVLVFVVHDDCKDVMRTLISYIRDMEEVELYAIGSHLDLGEEVMCIDSNPEAVLFQKFSKNAVSDTDIYCVSPYEEKVLSIRDISKCGIWLGRNKSETRSIETIEKELDIVNKIYDGLKDSEDKLIPFYGTYLDNEYFIKIEEKVSKINYPFLYFILPIHESVFYENYELLEKTRQCKFIIQLENEVSDEMVVQFAKLIQEKKISKIVFPACWLEKKTQFIQMLVSAQKSKLLRMVPVGKADSHKIDQEIRKVIFENTRERYLPLYRGFIKSRTGLYADVKLDGYVHHVEISDKILEDAEKSFMNENVSLKSSVYIKDKKITEDTGMLYFDKNGIARNSLGEKTIFAKENVNPSNIIMIDGNEVKINNLAYTSNDRIYQISYKNARKSFEQIKKRGESDNVVYIFSILDGKDFELFLQDAEVYKNTHKMDETLLAYGYLENSCRFLGYLDCGVDKIPRMKIDDNGMVHLCDSSTEALQHMSVSLFELSHNCFAKREKKFQERGCYECPTRNWCSKCSELPEYMDKKYCEIMKKHAYILDYVLMSSVFLKFASVNPVFRDVKPSEVTISNEYMFNLIADEIKGEVAPYLPKFTSIILCRDKYFLWSPKTNKYYNISKEFACLVELLLRRVKAEKLPELLAGTLNISVEESKEIISVILNTLKRAEILYRDIE